MRSRAVHVMLAMGAMLAAGHENYAGRTRSFEPDTPDTKDLKERYKKVQEAKGLKEYDIEGHKVMAMNYKNALRKIKNLRTKKTN